MTPPIDLTIVMTMKLARLSEPVAAGEFKAKCLELMDRVAETGESIVITKRGKPVARLGPAVERLETLRGFFKGGLEIVGDIVGPSTSAREWDALVK